MEKNMEHEMYTTIMGHFTAKESHERKCIESTVKFTWPFAWRSSHLLHARLTPLLRFCIGAPSRWKPELYALKPKT